MGSATTEETSSNYSAKNQMNKVTELSVVLRKQRSDGEDSSGAETVPGFVLLGEQTHRNPKLKEAHALFKRERVPKAAGRLQVSKLLC